MRKHTMAEVITFALTDPKTSTLLKQVMADNDARKGTPTYLNPNVNYK